MTTYHNHSLHSFSSITGDTFTFNDLNGYYVTAVGDISDSTITFGNGASDYVSVGSSCYATITMGNGALDHVYIAGSVGNHDNITLGNGAQDTVSVGSGGHDVIIVGNGNLDAITVGNPDYDTIITGTGFDKVTVAGVPPTALSGETFGFALGTGVTASSQTTVSGELLGAHVAVGSSSGLVTSGNDSLGVTLVQEGHITGIISVNGLIAYVSSHGGLTKGDTYTADSGGHTFVVTDTANGHTGGIEIVGVVEHFLLNPANHELTLL